MKLSIIVKKNTNNCICMTLDSNGMLTGEVMHVYHSALAYLKKTGFDFKRDTSGEIVVTMFPIDKNLFTSTNPDDWLLPIPYKVDNDVISETFMEVLELRKEIDLRRYLRVISIILNQFSGPEKDDTMANHVSSLRGHFRFNNRGYQEEAIIRALHVSEQFTRKRAECHKTLVKKDYIAFARILNTLFLLYNSYQKKGLTITFLKDIHKKLLKYLENPQTRTMLFDRLSYYNIIDINSEDELVQIANSLTERVKLIKKIRDWVTKQQADPYARYRSSFKLEYGKINDVELLKIIKHFSYSETLATFLTRFGIVEITKSELERLQEKPKERLALVNKIVEYCEKMPFD